MNKLVIPGKLESLPQIRQYVAEASASAALGAGRGYGLGLAVDEIATNIIVHGYREHGLSGDLCLSVEMTDTELRLIMEDTSPSFDPRSLAPPKDQLDKPLEQRPIGGLGVYLAFQSIDGFDYRAGSVNRSVFKMKRDDDKSVGPEGEGRV